MKPPPPPRSSSNSNASSSSVFGSDSSNASNCGSDDVTMSHSHLLNDDRASKSPAAHAFASVSKPNGGGCTPYASSPVVAPTASDDTAANPPPGYVLAGQMSLGGAIRIPAFNSANLSKSLPAVNRTRYYFPFMRLPLGATNLIFSFADSPACVAASMMGRNMP